MGDLRAFGHPLRLRLLELLEAVGPLTATQAAALAGTSPSNASFHLRLLSRHGFVEEADGGTGRQRPWRSVDTALSIEVDELDDDGRRQVRGVIEVMAARYRNTVLAWQQHREAFDERWRDAAGDTHLMLHLTHEELAELSATVHGALLAFVDRPRPEGTLPIAVTFSAVPVHVPAAPTTTSTEERA